MLEIINTLVAVAALGISLTVAVRMMLLESKLVARQALQSSQQQSLPISEPPPRPLEGLRIGLAIQQDHPHPVFASILKEQLLAEDVTEVSTDNIEDGDIVIEGNLVCNGYAEIYYSADLACRTPNEPICTLIEKPPHGDRPQNLAIELVARLKREMEKLETRNERRSAIRELRGN